MHRHSEPRGVRRLRGEMRGALIIAAGTSQSFVRQRKRSENRGKASSIPKVVMGAAILLAGLYMLWLAF